jgi:Protein of unknown function (DUF974)
MVEVTNAGNYTLEVGVTYLPHSGEHPRTFRKMYNFTTFDTVHVRSIPINYKNRSVVFQLEIQNTGDAPIHLTQVRFHAESAWDAKSCNELVEGQELGIFGERAMLPREIFQTMHMLLPKKGVQGEMPFALGRVEIEWVGNMGERGSLTTGLHNRRPI